ncbi:hypothetical protein VE00_04860 [Pseudogymnoascus sp. WSF 3629]|nr:hypothetical protein VE00_04860 [Pseudogymnoascus sp. WSF 3629]
MATKGTSPVSGVTGYTAEIEERRALYLSYIEYCNAHNFKAMESFYTSPINVNDEPWAPSKATAQFKPLIAAFPDWHWEIRNLTIEGDYLALHLRVTGTHRGTFQGIEPTGCRVTASQFTLYHLVDGKFADVWDLVDTDSVIKQIEKVDSTDYAISFFRWNGTELIRHPLPPYAARKLEERYQFNPANRPQIISYTDDEFEKMFGSENW